MHILVLNSGSSSIKFSVLATDGGAAEPEILVDGEAGALGTEAAAIAARASGTGTTLAPEVRLQPNDGPEAASAAIAAVLRAEGVPTIDAVGYRVVHPGPRLREHCALTPEVLDELRAATVFAPLHQPPTLHLMEELRRHLPNTPAFCCFDTVFHETMPEEASVYALPEAVRRRGVRRYGFHGLSCEGVVRHLRARAAKPNGRPVPRRLIVAHLGSGCSVTSILDGESVDNSMGLTPDGGVVMGTRPGDLDPGVVLYLLRVAGGEPRESLASVESMLNRDAGVRALSGMANDMKAVRAAAVAGETKAALAVRVFARGVRKAIGSSVAVLAGVDALVFTGGIGEHDAQARTEILVGMNALGLRLDPERNRAGGLGAHGMATISSADDSAEILVVPAEEDRTIARHVARLASASGNGAIRL